MNMEARVATYTDGEREGLSEDYFFGAGFVVLVVAADVALMPRASFTAWVRSSAVLPVASSVPDSKIEAQP